MPGTPGVTALFIAGVLLAKKLLRVDGQNKVTPANLMGSLSFWGVPDIDLDRYRLTIDGAVAETRTLSIDELRSLPSCSSLVRMDCVGGFRNNSVMDGVSLRQLLQGSGVGPDVCGPSSTVPMVIVRRWTWKICWPKKPS